jgi:site-specific DNA-cytosine methylase
MRVLDLFTGLGGWSKAFRDRGHVVDTLDIDQKFKPTFCMSVLDVKPDMLRGYDLILASPPCECFSVASIGHHWTGGLRQYIPRTVEARCALDLIRHTFRILKRSNFVLENPRGVLRKVAPIQPSTTVWYCQYGDERAKPTDIWTSIKELKWRPQCYNNNPVCHHARAKRGAKTGTQGRKGPELRALIPYGLSLDVCLQMEALLNQ